VIYTGVYLRVFKRGGGWWFKNPIFWKSFQFARFFKKTRSYKRIQPPPPPPRNFFRYAPRSTGVIFGYYRKFSYFVELLSKRKYTDTKTLEICPPSDKFAKKTINHT